MREYAIQFNEYTAHTRQWLVKYEDEAQAIFRKAKESGERPKCTCTINQPAFYIAYVEKR